MIDDGDIASPLTPGWNEFLIQRKNSDGQYQKLSKNAEIKNVVVTYHKGGLSTINSYGDGNSRFSKKIIQDLVLSRLSDSKYQEGDKITGTLFVNEDNSVDDDSSDDYKQDGSFDFEVVHVDRIMPSGDYQQIK